MSHTHGGVLIAIGGAEDRRGERRILREVASRLRGGRLVLATVASYNPHGYYHDYKRAFRGLGVHDLVELYVRQPGEAHSPELLRLMQGATGVFFSGGDQNRIRAQIGGSPIERRVREVLNSGGVVAGTSAGASVMSRTMLAMSGGHATHRIGDSYTADGLGLIEDIIIDQHFAERGRFGRLLGAVAENPTLIGAGIDENTAIVCQGGRFRVVGSGGVYVMDPTGVTHSNVDEGRADESLSIHDVRVHLLGDGDEFDLTERRPMGASELGASQRLERRRAARAGRG